MIWKYVPQNEYVFLFCAYNLHSSKQVFLSQILEAKETRPKSARTLAIFVWKKWKPKKMSSYLLLPWQFVREDEYWYSRHAGERKKWKYFNFMRIWWSLVYPLPAELSTFPIYPVVSHKWSLKHWENLSEEVGLKEDIILSRRKIKGRSCIKFPT